MCGIMQRLDILNLEWPKSDRDLHIVTPIVVYLRKRYGLQCETKSIFNGYYYLIRYRPKLLLISNFSGAILNHELVKAAYQMGITVVSLISEGNVKPEAVDQFLWGWNRDKVLYVHKMLLWSRRSEQIFVNTYPKLKDQWITTGATGFDRYKLLTFADRDQFLKDHDFAYRKIIGMAAWGFDHLFGDYYEKHADYYLKVFGQAQIEMHRKDLFLLQNIYRALIEQNPDTLFILRYHPGTIDKRKNEFYQLEEYPNVFISSKEVNTAYKISDLIYISDLWIGYETTTALEAWLLGKQTLLINPTRSDFVRENVHKGSPIAVDLHSAQALIDEYFANRTLKAFESLAPFRAEIIQDVMEYDDGQNHQRAAEVIYNEIFNQPHSQIHYSFSIYKQLLKQWVKLGLSRSFFPNRWKELDYQADFAQSYQQYYTHAVHV